MKYKYAIGHCSECGMLTKWQKKCPKGKWHCMRCKGGTQHE